MIQSPPVNNPKPAVFVKQSLAELKKVVWPTKKKVLRMTIIVITVSLLTGLFIGGLDYLFTQIMGLII